MLNYQLRDEIAEIVRAFSVRAPGELGGNCGRRVALGEFVLRQCGLSPKIVFGSMLFRTGKHRMRDTLPFAMGNNKGGFIGSMFIGHVWLELDGDLIDFACGDWPEDCEELYAAAIDPLDIKLGPLQWDVLCPEYIWRPARPLKAAWKQVGVPTVGSAWYGPWDHRFPSPDLGEHIGYVELCRPHVERLVAERNLVERASNAGMAERYRND